MNFIDSPYDIRNRLLDLQKIDRSYTQAWLRRKLEANGENADRSAMSKYVNGELVTQKSEKLMKMCHGYICEAEKELGIGQAFAVNCK